MEKLTLQLIRSMGPYAKVVVGEELDRLKCDRYSINKEKAEALIMSLLHLIREPQRKACFLLKATELKNELCQNLLERNKL